MCHPCLSLTSLVRIRRRLSQIIACEYFPSKSICGWVEWDVAVAWVVGDKFRRVGSASICSSMVSAAHPIDSDFRMAVYDAVTGFLASFRISRRKTRVV